ncbi:MAG TPA: hypothetical protein VG873_08110 [Burkholderiales bacterium]|nr:hypothetical protein [Burkholderiales bacterium]
MSKAIVAAVVLAALALGGCASSMMVPSASQEVRPAAAGKVQVVFMRTSIVAGAIGADLFEVENGRLQYIGSLSHGYKIVHETTPGKKTFMAYGTAADFMLGDLEAGKTYYSIVRPNWGSGGMIPTPIKVHPTAAYNTSMPEFRKWIADTKRVEPIPAERDAWMAKEKDRMQQIYAQYWAQFQGKSDAQKAERTLEREDGMR